MRRFTALVAAALALAAPAHGLAKGGYVRRPEPEELRARPPVTEPEFSPGQVPLGCRPRRVRDQVAYKCRGPVDIGN